jgi:hypothetical protein
MKIVLYSSSHGFGHASRDAQVLRALHAAAPDVSLHWRTGVAPWFLADALREVPHERSHAVLDVGICQPHGTEQDLSATLAACTWLREQHAALVQAEVCFLESLRPDYVVSDVAGIPLAAAARCHIPAVALSNFSWDWIYRELRDPAFAPIVDCFAHDYAQAKALLRLPFHGGQAAGGAFGRQVDLPLVARRSQLTIGEARERLGFAPELAYFLVSFGGLGAGALDLAPLASREHARFRFVLTPPWQGPATSAAESLAVESLAADSYVATSPGLQPSAPDLHAGRLGSLLREATGHVVLLDTTALAPAGLTYEDLVRACDGVITKPGYGIVSECLANETRVLYTSRGAFAEYPYLVAGLQAYGCAEFISNHDLYSGCWLPSLERLMARPRRACALPCDGAQVAAAWLLGPDVNKVGG